VNNILLKINQREFVARLKLELLCSGIQLSDSVLQFKEFREIIRTRGGLGSGIELILPNNLWVNVPTYEYFAKSSPFCLIKSGESYWVEKNNKKIVKVKLAPQPKFYSLKTSTDVPMKRIGTLQGGYLAFFPTSSCEFWPDNLNCRFCSTGLNLGTSEHRIKKVQEILEVAREAFKEKVASFIHVNIGFTQSHDRGLLKLAPYIKALKKETDAIIICQCLPPKTNEWADYAYSIGVDSMSSNFEFYNIEIFKKYCPGKAKFIGHKRFFEWLEYLPTIFPSGGAAGEIIVGIEPIESSLAAIDYITSTGAHPIICAFRPLIGTALEKYPPPTAEIMEKVLVYAYKKCKENSIKLNAVDRVSIVMMVHEARLLISNHRDSLMELIMQKIARTNFGKKLFKKIILDKKRKLFNKKYIPNL